MTVAIRELGLADKVLLEELLDACMPEWGDQLDPTASSPLAFLADSKAFVFGAYVNNEPAGWAWGVQIRRPEGRSMSYLHELEVLGAHHRKGIATSLMEAAINQARSSGSGQLWLITRTTNQAAQGLYRSLGGVRASEAGEIRFRWDL